MVLKHMASGAYYINLFYLSIKIIVTFCAILKSNIRELAVVEQSKCSLINLLNNITLGFKVGAIDRHSNLLYHCINYSCKKFYSKGPWGKYHNMITNQKCWKKQRKHDKGEREEGGGGEQ